MKFKLVKLLPLSVIPFACIPTSCASGVNPLVNVINIVKDNFNAPNIDLGEVSTIEEAKELFIKEFLDSNSDITKANEILFDTFNFLGVEGLTISNNSQNNYSVQILPTGYSFIKLYDEKKCTINTQYDYRFERKENNYFNFLFKGYVNIQMVDDFSLDNINLKKGDFVQFVYDMESWMKLEINAKESADKFFSDIVYSYTKLNTLDSCVGLIKLTLNGEYYPDIAIKEINDANFTTDQHHLHYCVLKNA